MTVEAPDPPVVRFDRAEFLAERWAYEPGEHVTIIGSNGSGKTYLGYQLLEQSMSAKLVPIVLVIKPRDATVVTWSRQVGLRTVRSWPPITAPGLPKPPGWVVWPKHQHDPDRDDYRIWQESRKVILDSYKRGNRILFCDETAGLVEVGLKRELETVWMRGRSMGCGVWAATQRPANIPLHAYSNAMHVFLAREADKRSRDRYAEISGVDPDVVRSIVMNLKRHQFLYINQSGPYLCIVDK